MKYAKAVFKCSLQKVDIKNTKIIFEDEKHFLYLGNFNLNIEVNIKKNGDTSCVFEILKNNYKYKKNGDNEFLFFEKEGE